MPCQACFNHIEGALSSSSLPSANQGTPLPLPFVLCHRLRRLRPTQVSRFLCLSFGFNLHLHSAATHVAYSTRVAFARPGHWLGPVTGPGWLGLAQPMWAELGPALKNKKKINRKK